MNKKQMKFDSNGIAASNSFLSSIALEVLEAERQERACRRACSDADFDNATYGTWNISDRDWYTNLTFLIMTDQQMSATIYKGLFTDAEWQIIDYALSEYQDHLDEDDNEIEIFNSIQAKLNAIFTLTKWKILTSKI